MPHPEGGESVTRAKLISQDGMTELRHYDHDGRVRFVTFSTHQRLPILTNNQFRSFVTESIDISRTEHGFLLLAYVVMPEHVHVVLYPRPESKVGQVIGYMKQESAKRIVTVLRQRNSRPLERLAVVRDDESRTAIWQRRCYDHNCREESDVWEKIDYCHKNPVTRGLVNDPSKWVYSSFNAYYSSCSVPLRIDEPRFDVFSHPAGGAPIENEFLKGR